MEIFKFEVTHLSCFLFIFTHGFMPTCAIMQTQPAKVNTYPVNLSKTSIGVSAGVWSTQPPALPTLPPDSMFNNAEKPVKALFELLKSEIKWRMLIDKRLPDIEAKLFSLEQIAGKLTEALNQTNKTTEATEISLRDLKDEIQQVKVNFSSVANEVITTKQQSKNESEGMKVRIQNLESNVNTQRTSTNKSIETFKDIEEALEKSLTEMASNVSTDLSELKNKTKRLEDVLSDPSAAFALVRSDYFNDTINELTDKVSNASSTANSAKTTIDKWKRLLLGEIKNLYNITSRQEVNLVKNTKDLKSLTNFMNKNLTAEIKSMKSNFLTEIDSLQTLHNSSIDNIFKKVKELNELEGSKFENLTRSISENEIRYFENLALTDQNVQNIVREVRELSNNVTKTERGLKQKKDELDQIQTDLKSNFDSLNVTTEAALLEFNVKFGDLKDHYQSIEKQQNESLHTLQTKLDTKDKELENLKLTLTSDLSKVLTSSQQNITKLEEKLNQKFLHMKGESNTSELLKKIEEVDLKIDSKEANLSKQMKDFNEICHEGILRVDSNLRSLAISQNNYTNRLTQSINSVKGNLNSVFNLYNQTLQNLGETALLNITKIDQKLGNEYTKLGELDNAVKGIGNNVSNLWKSVENMKSDKSGDLSELKETISKNLTATKKEFQTYIASMITTENSNIQNFLQGIQRVDKKINELSQNYSQALHQVHGNSLKDKGNYIL